MPVSTVSPAEGVCRNTRLPKNEVTSTLSPAALRIVGGLVLVLAHHVRDGDLRYALGHRDRDRAAVGLRVVARAGAHGHDLALGDVGAAA